MRVARIAPHLWEEPFLSGQSFETPVRGSGAVFFCGCNLGCVFCQNYKISRRRPSDTSTDSVFEVQGKPYSPSALADQFLRLQEEGVHNINLVTAGHFTPSVIEAISLSRARGLIIPTVWNSSSYETVDTLRMLEGLIDVYLPDYKYASALYAMDYSSAPDYPQVCRAAIAEMVRQTGKPVFDNRGYLLRGTAVRHLILPGCDADSVNVLKDLYLSYGPDTILLSLMNQYTPLVDNPRFPELSESLPRAAYLRVVEKAQALGFRYLYTQDDGTASESFIPFFDSE